MQVLLVDDHPVILEVMQAVLRRCLAPTAIHTEKDLESALRKARRLTRLDLVVLDLLLPGCQGIDAHGDRPHGFDSQGLAAPEFGLSARQLEVLKRIVKGLHNKQIADELQISENTVKHHTHEVFKALGVTTRTEALLVSVRRHFPLEG